MKRSYRIPAALAALALAAGCTLPAFAASEVSKDENVFIILNADGSVKSQTVSDWVHSDSGLSGFADTTSLQNVTNLKGDWQLQQAGGQITFQGSGSDVYYQGSTDKTPPVSAATTYTLNGAPITAEALLGRAGHVAIHIALTNNERYQRTIGGEKREVYTPFVTMVAVDLPAGSFTDITAPHGTVQTDAQNQLAAFVALPGMKATVSGLLPAQLGGLYDYFLDEVTVEADTEGFEMPSIMLAAATSMEELKTDGILDTSDFDDLDGKLDELKTATQDLQSGINELKNATGDLVNGVTTLNDAVGTLNSGAGDLKDGAQKLADGASSVASGAASLNSLMGELCKNNDTLNQGANSIFSALLASATTQLRAQAGAMGLDPAAIPALSAGNYKEVIGELLAGLGEENIYAQAKAKVEAEVYTDANREKAAQQVTAVVAATLYVKQTQPDAGEEAQNTAVQAILADQAQVAQILQDSAMQQALAQEETQAMIAQTVQAQLDAAVTAALSEGGAAYEELQKALAAAGAGSQQLNGALAQLDQVNSFVNGLASYTSGAQQIYQRGTAPLNEGAKQVRDGANDLKGGAEKLKDGTASLKDGTQTLLDGAIKLSGGAGDLASGMEEYKTEGIDQLTGKLDDMDLVALKDLEREVKALADSYTSYTGAPEGVKASVKFVMKVEGPEAPEESEAPAGQQQAAQPDAPPAEKASFWQRIKNLFR